MDMKRLISDEREIQYFGISSTDFYEDLVQSVVSYLRLCIDEMKKAYLAKISTNRDIIEKEMELLHDTYVENCQKILLKVKVEVHKYFEIPDQALPDCSLLLNIQNNKIDVEQEIKLLEEELRKEMLFEHLCKEELKCLEEFQSIYERVNDDLNNLSCLKKNIKQQDKLMKHIDLHDNYLKFMGSAGFKFQSKLKTDV